MFAGGSDPLTATASGEDGASQGQSRLQTQLPAAVPGINTFSRNTHGIRADITSAYDHR